MMYCNATLVMQRWTPIREGESYDCFDTMDRKPPFACIFVSILIVTGRVLFYNGLRL